MLPAGLTPCALDAGPHSAVPVAMAMTAIPAVSHPSALTPAGRRALRMRPPMSLPAAWATGTKTMLTRAAPRTTWPRITGFGLVMQLPAVGGWAYWMLSDSKQRPMAPALDSTRALTAATAAPTATESATFTAD